MLVTVEDTTTPTLIGPDDLTYEYGSTGHQLVWTASDSHPDTYRLRIDGITGDWTTWTGGEIAVAIDGLDIGTHTYFIEVRDISGNTVSDTVVVIVEDTTAPVLSSPDDIVMVFGETGHNITWWCEDLNPANYSVTLDGTVIASGTWTSNVTVVLDALPVGQHVILIVVTDGSGNSAEDSVTVTVQASTTGNTTTTSTTTTTTTNPNTTNPTGPSMGGQFAIILVLIVGAAIVSVIVIVMVLRKRMGA